MKKCPRCGRDIDEEEKFCPYCGLDLNRKYRPVKKDPPNKAMTYLLYVIIFFSFIIIPMLYQRVLTSVNQEIAQLDNKTMKLPAVEKKDPSTVIAQFDTLANFNDKFSNVDSVVKGIEEYEAKLFKKSSYVFDKKYTIVVLDNYNIIYNFVYTTKINDHLSLNITKQYDRSHTHNTERITFNKSDAQDFDGLFLSEEEMKTVYTFTDDQTEVDKIIGIFKNRKDEFEEKKERIGHYGLGSYEDKISFVAHKRAESYSSVLEYSAEPKDYIS